MKTIKTDIQWLHDGEKSMADMNGHQVVMGKGKDPEKSSPSPMDLFLASLGGCMVVFISRLAEKSRITLNNIQVWVEGDYDPEGIASRNRGIRVGFQQIRYKVSVDSPAPQEKIEKLVHQAIELCPVKDSLRGVEVVEAELTVNPN